MDEERRYLIKILHLLHDIESGEGVEKIRNVIGDRLGTLNARRVNEKLSLLLEQPQLEERITALEKQVKGIIDGFNYFNRGRN